MPAGITGECRDAPSQWSVTMQKIDRMLVSKKELKLIGIPYSFQHIARLEKAGQFPKRVVLGQCRVAWVYAEVCKWIEDRVAKRDPEPFSKSNS